MQNEVIENYEVALTGATKWLTQEPAIAEEFLVDTIVFNPASLESTIAAAILKKELKSNMKIVAIPSTGKFTDIKSERVFWVGVQPEYGRKNLAYENIIFSEFSDMKLGKEFTQVDYSNFNHTLDTEGIPHGEIPVACRNMVYLVELYLHRPYVDSRDMVSRFPLDFHEALVKFNNNTKNMELRDSALLMHEHRNSYNYLMASRTVHRTVGVTQYCETIDNMRHRLRKLPTYYIKGIQVPVLNAPLEDAPWLAKIVMFSWDSCAVYEHKGDKLIYQVFSRDKTVQDPFQLKKMVIDSLGGGITHSASLLA